MENIKLLGADIGNDALKIVMLKKTIVDGKEKTDIQKVEVMNVVSQGYERRILGGEKGHLSNLLDVNIEMEVTEDIITNGKITGSKKEVKDIGRYFVGGIAYKYGKGDIIEKTAQDVKAKNNDSIILLVTGVAYALYDSNKPEKVENIAVGTLLPTEEYFEETEDLVELFNSKLLNKTFTVKFNSPVFNGAKITIKFVDTDIEPEGTAGQLAVCFNYDGSAKEELEKIKEGIYLGVFVGNITTELAIFDHGEFDPRGFIGIKLGTANPLDSILADLRNKGLDNMTRHQIDFIIRNKKPLIISTEKGNVDLTEDLNKFTNNRFSYFTKLLVNRIFTELSRNGINISFFNGVNLGGGGASLYFNEFKKEFNKGNVNLVDDPRFANAIGALIAIVQKQNNASAGEKELFKEIAADKK